MCVYCMVGDFYDKYWPIYPSQPPPSQPIILQPVQPVVIPDVQELERLREIQEILKRVKELEDKLGCPCDDPAQRGKPEYIKKIQDRLDELEKRTKA